MFYIQKVLAIMFYETQCRSFHVSSLGTGKSVSEIKNKEYFLIFMLVILSITDGKNWIL